MNEKNPYASMRAIAFIVAKGISPFISRFKLNHAAAQIEIACAGR